MYTVLQAHGHVGHDTIMYVSGAGGCCDCGDASWLDTGCCPEHRSGQQLQVAVPPLLPAAETALSAALGLVCSHLCIGVQGATASFPIWLIDLLDTRFLGGGGCPDVAMMP